MLQRKLQSHHTQTHPSQTSVNPTEWPSERMTIRMDWHPIAWPSDRTTIRSNEHPAVNLFFRNVSLERIAIRSNDHPSGWPFDRTTWKVKILLCFQNATTETSKPSYTNTSIPNECQSDRMAIRPGDHPSGLPSDRMIVRSDCHPIGWPFVT